MQGDLFGEHAAMRTGARESGGGVYRYDLLRGWSSADPLIFVMLNPSKADARDDDPTIRRCIAFARRELAGGIYVINLFAFRATDPRELLSARDPVGPENIDLFRGVCEWPCDDGAKQPPIVLAWGAVDRRLAWQRDTALGWLRGHEDRFYCLGTTKAGEPRHPLFVRSDQPLVPWPASREGRT